MEADPDAGAWEGRYRAGDTPWQKGVASPGLVLYLRESPLSGKVLVPGCGFGHDAYAIASRGGPVEVTGMDIAPSAIDASSRTYSLPNLAYRTGDFLGGGPGTSADGSSGKFDGLWEHTLFCAIDPARRTDYARAAADALRPQGVFLAIWYLNPGAGREGPPFGTTVEELAGLFFHRFELERAWYPAASYPGREGRELMWLLRRKD